MHMHFYLHKTFPFGFGFFYWWGFEPQESWVLGFFGLVLLCWANRIILAPGNVRKKMLELKKSVSAKQKIILNKFSGYKE